MCKTEGYASCEQKNVPLLGRSARVQAPPLFVAFAPSPWTPVVDLRSLDPLIYSILTLAPFQTHVLDASPTAIE